MQKPDNMIEGIISQLCLYVTCLGLKIGLLFSISFIKPINLVKFAWTVQIFFFNLLYIEGVPFAPSPFLHNQMWSFYNQTLILYFLYRQSLIGG